ncbi:GAF and ANTAR domain-containing protein [Aeromicrobium sp. CTD01-1L150]|uniref:GAF and ANTAR domain-containing protein n=1 Tax=Aeromicrobium sp. CTD01-1L150 TaxID=3341830 RepID=UPI0035BFA9F9
MTRHVHQALAEASAALVGEHDVAGTARAMVGGVLRSVDGEICGIMLGNNLGVLEVLTCGSHRAEELDLFEGLSVGGPCADAWHGDTVVTASLDEARRDWPDVAEAMRAAGLGSVAAVPLRWYREPLGALVVFWTGAADVTADDRAVLQAFADLSMLLVIHADRVSVRSAAQRVDAALAGRVIIEEAKGVLAHEENLTMEHAYDRLRQLADVSALTLTDVARRIVRNAAMGGEKPTAG